MILRNATIKYKGYDPNDLKPKSNKRICCSCDGCGRVRWVMKQRYRSLCNSCKQIGKNNSMFGIHRIGKDAPNYGKHLSEDHKDKISKSNRNKSKSNEHKINIKNNHADFQGNKNPNWRGGKTLRDHVKSSNRCIKINNWFDGCEGHHLMTGVIVYLPKDIHRHISHNLKNGRNMGIINLLALQFINGEL